MTPSAESVSDSYGHGENSLTPAERYIYTRAKRQPDEPFCFLDFKDKYAHGTIRNTFSSLRRKGLIRLYCRSGTAFYMLSSGKPKMPLEKMTVAHRVGRGAGGVREVRIDLGSFLESLDWEEVCRVHDITLVFPADLLYRLFSSNGVGRLIEGSSDIRFGLFVWSRGRVLEVFLHRGGKVTAYLKCSERPVEVSLDGLVSLSSFLGSVRARMVDVAISVDHDFDERLIPDVPDWVVSQWHYGKDGDGACEISGPAFNVSFSNWFGDLARIYMRHNGQLLKPRLEIHEKPRKTLPVAFAEKIDPSFSVLSRLKVE
ncbi:MAG: hypothetical protein QXM65_07830 [Candidatus Bathyarchaeia archaeon]